MFNITLFIQAFNFLIVYWVLSRFFFKPILQLIVGKEDEILFLENLIISCRTRLDDCAEKRHKLWISARKKYTKCITTLIVNLGEALHAHDSGIEKLPESLVANVEKQDDLAKALVDKIIS